MDLYFCGSWFLPILGQDQTSTEEKVGPRSNTLQVLYILKNVVNKKKNVISFSWRERSTHYKILKLMCQEYLDNITKQVTDYQGD